MRSLSIVIITKNEEKNLPRCLESVKWADEIVIVDSGSTDKTLEIAKSYNAKIFEHEWQGYGNQKIFAITQASKDWILNMDADEVVSPQLARTIESICKSKDITTCGYIIYRQTDFLGRWMNHCWGNEYKLRLFKHGTGNFDREIVHEALHIDGEVRRIHAPLLHYPFPNLDRYFVKFHEYAQLFVKQNFDRKKSSLFKILGSPLALFFKMYIRNRGFFDGWQGFLLSILSSYHAGYKYALLWKAQRQNKRPV